MAPRKPLEVGDSIAVVACGVLVDVRTVAKVTSRTVRDSAGQLWTKGGERWGFADSAFDSEFIRHARPGEKEHCLQHAQSADVLLARRRSALNRLPWAAPASRPGLQPGGLTVEAVFKWIQQDPAVAAWLEANL